MPAATLTRTQKRMVRELDQIAMILRLNYREIETYKRSIRLPRLKLVKDNFVRGEIILAYTFIDECLSNFLCQHFFGRKANFRKLWKTKRFRNFNYFVIEKLYLTEKLAYAKAIRTIPRSVSEDIERLNALRNALAHAFFPDNLRSFQPKKGRGLRGPKVKWKGLNIFSFQGIQRFVEDMATVDDFLAHRVYGSR